MFNFFDYIVSVFTSIVSFFSSLIANVIWYIRIFGACVDYLFKAVAFIPPIFSVFAIGTIIVCVFLALVGRNAGGQQ